MIRRRAVLPMLFILWLGRLLQAQTCGPQWLPGDPLAGVDGVVYASTMWDPDGSGPHRPKLVVGGVFAIAGSVVANNVAIYSDESKSWSALGEGTDGPVYSLASMPTGELIVGGRFFTAGQVSVNLIAKWDGNSWSSLGQGVISNLFPAVRALLVTPAGNLIVGGRFDTAGNQPARGVARWDGTSWFPLGLDGPSSVWTLAMMPDGDLIAGGFVSGGAAQSEAPIARWNGSSWSAFGSPLASPLSNNQISINAIAIADDGSVIAGGQFIVPENPDANNLARWNGNAWVPVNPSETFFVSAMSSQNNGDIFLVGHFAGAGSSGGASVARLRGSDWLNIPRWPYLGNPFAVNCVSTGPDGTIAVGGVFYASGDIGASSVILWDGVRWSAPVRSGDEALGGETLTTTTSSVQTLAVTSSNELLVGGSFTRQGGRDVPGLLKWNGSAWSPFPGAAELGLNDVSRITITTDERVVVAGNVPGGSPAIPTVALWDGTSWRYETFEDTATALTGIADGRFIVARGSQWSFQTDADLWNFVEVADAGIFSLLPQQNGDIIAAGGFRNIGGQAANRVARWNGASWSPLGAGMDAFVGVLIPTAAGDIVAGGQFFDAGNVRARRVARWDGQLWQRMGQGVNHDVRAMVQLADGRIVSGGGRNLNTSVPADSIAIWDGTTWSSLGGGVDRPRIAGNDGVGSGRVNAIALLPNGELVVGGDFTTAGGIASPRLARYTFTGIPTVSIPPFQQTILAGQTLVLASTPSNGYRGVSVQWYRDGSPIADGAAGSSSGGGVVSGAVMSLASPTRRTLAELVITNAQASDTGQYAALFSNNCGSVWSSPAMVVVVVPCTPSDVAGVNQSTGPDGQLSADDIIMFLGWFFAEDIRADVAGFNASTTPDGTFTADDIIVFLGRFFAGC